jgi:hypothetical protein
MSKLRPQQRRIDSLTSLHSYASEAVVVFAGIYITVVAIMAILDQAAVLSDLTAYATIAAVLTLAGYPTLVITRWFARRYQLTLFARRPHTARFLSLTTGIFGLLVVVIQVFDDGLTVLSVGMVFVAALISGLVGATMLAAHNWVQHANL